MLESASSSDRLRWLSAADDGLLADCDVHTYRASGPGGQKRNKTDSAVRLRHRPTGLTVVATESRSQHENRARALHRLRCAIALGVRAPLPADATRRPDCAARYIGAAGHLRIDPKNPDYPQFAAWILDVLGARAGRLAETAEVVGTTTAQLTRFFGAEKRMRAAVNRLRAAHGQSALGG